MGTALSPVSAHRDRLEARSCDVKKACPDGSGWYPAESSPNVQRDRLEVQFM